MKKTTLTTFAALLVFVSGSLGATPSAQAASHHQHKKQKHHSHPVFSGWQVPASQFQGNALPKPSGDLELYAVNFKETVKVHLYKPDGSFDDDAIDQLDYLFRCRRTGTEKPIEPHLFEVLSVIYDHYGKPIELVSGFRNQTRLTSYHFHGSASDIRIPGVSEKALRDYVATLDTGNQGLGLYPRAGFIHVDVRPGQSFRWIDYSPPGTSDMGHPHNGHGKKKRNT